MYVVQATDITRRRRGDIIWRIQPNINYHNIKWLLFINCRNGPPYENVLFKRPVARKVQIFLRGRNAPVINQTSRDRKCHLGPLIILVVNHPSRWILASGDPTCEGGLIVSIRVACIVTSPNEELFNWKPRTCG